MTTLAIALCMVLVVLPVSAQQIVGARAPNFYVPYGVRDVQPKPVEDWSTPEVEFPPPAYEAPAAAPYRQRYPVRRGGYTRYGYGFGGYQGPVLSSRGDVLAYASPWAFLPWF